MRFTHPGYGKLYKTAGFLFVLAAMVLSLERPLAADRIVMKDGTVEESERVWESKGYIHFILRGTRSVEIRYARALVERIERKGQPTEQIAPTEVAKPDESVGERQTTPPAEPAVQLSETDRQSFEKLRGIAFYDPRRPKRYWADVESHHSTLEDAVDALARQYGRSPEWVLKHVGEENDLALIHESLHHGESKQGEGSASTRNSMAAGAESAAQAHGESVEMPVVDAMGATGAVSTTEGGVQFYDPRRPEKYWVSPEQRFRTLSEALSALAVIYKKPSAWIEAHLGDSNELADIHRNLENSLAKSGNTER